MKVSKVDLEDMNRSQGVAKSAAETLDHVTCSRKRTSPRNPIKYMRSTLNLLEVFKTCAQLAMCSGIDAMH